MRKWWATLRIQKAELHRTYTGEGVDIGTEEERGGQASGSGNWGSGQVTK